MAVTVLDRRKLGWITKSGAQAEGGGTSTKQRNQKLLKFIKTSNHDQEKGGEIN